MSPMVCSATAWGEYAGTRTTAILYAAVRRTSTLLKPAHRSAMSFVPPAESIESTSASSTSFTDTLTSGMPNANATDSAVSRVS
jgi:hypothetical protein